MAENQVEYLTYHLKLPPIIKRLYLVFKIVKFMAIPKNIISGRCLILLLDLILIDEDIVMATTRHKIQ